ncbi:MAG: RsmB/NOP family class I SAM-dependent RNA methyltransferase [Thermoanaerobaculales bacterium]|nr:RsmB/NOP family class I SAM-dependent RNA methyltransferase [Thermoanaerobaculales bacterium]
MSTSADRERAARLLMRIEKGAFASRLLGRIPAAGVRTRVLGVLRWLRPLDAAVEKVAGRKCATLDPEVRAVLRIGLFEIEVLGIPAAVAGDGAVHLIRRLGKARASGLVNAVMRRAPGLVAQLLADGGPAFRNSHPDWLWRRWVSVFGEDRARKAMEAAQQPAALWAWFRDQGELNAFRDRGVPLTPHSWMPDAWCSKGRELVQVVAEGRAYAQDPASQLVAWLAVMVAREGATMVDLCAAPGGKAARAVRDGAFVLAVVADLNLMRLRLTDRLFSNVESGVHRVVQNAAETALKPGSWDVVLLDAPCTGTGTLRRHPELRWRLRPGDISERARLQEELIEAAYALVASGGVLLYSTCSMEPEENEAHFRTLRAGFEVEDVSVLLPEGSGAVPTSQGGFRLIPQENCDGFTVHALRRR